MGRRRWLMDPRKQLGANLRRARADRGLSQEDFALQSGIDRTYVSGIERGVRNPTVTVIARLAKALDIELHELLLPVPND